MKYVIDGVSYYVEQYGKGMPLVLLHGFTGDSSTWHPFYPEWGNESQIIAVDIIGHGKTDSPEDTRKYDITKVAHHLYLLLEKLQIDQTDMLGYSMGGRLALTFSILYRNKVRKLILESASPGLQTEKERIERRIQDNKLGEYMIENGIQSFVEKWENIPLFQSQECLSQEVKEQIRKQRLKNSVTGLANSLKGMGTGSQPSWWEELSKVDADVLLITGSEDQKFCRIAKLMDTKMKKVQIIMVDHCGHAIHLEQSEKFGTIVREFLKKQ